MTIPVFELGMAALAYFLLAARRVPPGRRALVMRRGRLREIRPPGFSLVVPFLDGMQEVRDGSREVECFAEGPEGARVKLTATCDIDNLETVVAKLPAPLRNFEAAARERIAGILRKEAEATLRAETLDGLFNGRAATEMSIRRYAADALAREGYRLRTAAIAYVNLPAEVEARLVREAEAERARRSPAKRLTQAEYEQELAALETADLTAEQKERVLRALRERRAE
jgi:hypothetical protein